MVTSDDLWLLRRSLESIATVTSGSGLQLLASVADPSEDILNLLERHSFKIHTFGSRRRKPESWLGRIVPALSIAEDIRQMARKLLQGGVCRADHVAPEIKFLHTSANGTSRISTFRPTPANLTEKERDATYIHHPYNPMLRRALVNSRKGSEGGGGVACKEAEQLKEALKFAVSALPDLKYLLLLESGLNLYPDFVSFFSQTLPAMQQDPSLYCISASNPLSPPAHPGDHARLYRLDHFAGGAAMVPRRLVEEIIKDFVVYEELLEDREDWGEGGRSKKSGMEWLTEWLSWWGRRYRRGCVVPDVPRVCPLRHSTPVYAPPHTCASLQQGGGKQPPRKAPPFDIAGLVHYRYSQELYKESVAAQALGGKVYDCNDPAFFPQPMNNSSYVIFFKMENYDDDFTFHHIMKCFDLDLPAAVGYFEGVFQVTFRGKRVFLIATPYSRFSPNMKEDDNLIIADIKSLFVRGQTNYLRHRHDNFTFSTVLVLHSMP